MQVALLQPFPPHDIVSPLLSLHCQHFLPVTPICHQNYHFQLQINSRTSSEGLGWTQCPPKEGSWPLGQSPNQFSGLQLLLNFLPAWAPSQSLRLSAQPDNISVFNKLNLQKILRPAPQICSLQACSHSVRSEC